MSRAKAPDPHALAAVGMSECLHTAGVPCTAIDGAKAAALLVASVAFLQRESLDAAIEAFRAAAKAHARMLEAKAGIS